MARRRRIRGPRGTPLVPDDEDDVVENVTHVPVDLPPGATEAGAAEVGEEIAEEPMLQLAHFASNDEWAFRQADRQVGRLRTRTHDKDDRTEGGVFDARTMGVLHKLLIHHVIKSVDLPIAEGKEAGVFRATTPRGGFLAVKIFRVNTATFHNFAQYIEGDERFEGIRGDRRTLMRAWTHKEYRNLRRMRDVGCSVPEPVKAVENVLLMEYLGKREGPWPQLRQARMADPREVYRRVVDDLVLTHNEAGLVHADVSEYNILLENADVDDARAQRPRLIDVGQAVLHTHPMAQEFLARDIHNLVRFFRRNGVDDASAEAIRARLHAPARDRWGEEE